MSQTCLCEVYKSLREKEMYLFVDKRDGLERVPEALLQRFGEPQLVTTLALTPQRRLARADAAAVLEHIRDRGYYLQMPPPRHTPAEASMQAMGGRNEKLPR